MENLNENILGDFDKIKSQFKELKAERQVLASRKEREEKKKEELESRLDNAEKGLAIIQSVAKDTQQNLRFHFSKLVTSSLKAVSLEWPDFDVEFVIRRNRTECDLYFDEFGTRQHPIESSGGGPKDVASFGLRCAYWALKKNRRVLVLDEPFRNVSPDLQRAVSDMVKGVSKTLGIQIVMVSHQDDINISADKTFSVVKTGKVSRITEGELGAVTEES